MCSSHLALAVALAAAVTLPSAAFAQSPVETAADEGEIVVTARRQNERLIDVPASVAVLSADVIAKTGPGTGLLVS